ncbi:MAG: nodulation protein NfeD [Chloroflexi bacterium]|nr:nodulation protein NfeD [Chloroflexota bacterium]
MLTVTGVIDTWNEGYISRGISVAEQNGAETVVILLNTPGGSLGATQNIVMRLLNARVPTIVYVSPQGAWAGSAGTFITLAGNIAAMAPGTTIGAAHPVDSNGQNIEGDMRDKVTNISVSLIQTIARERGRNEEWAANAVKNSISATAQQALDQKVIDLIATDLNDLLAKVDGKNVKTTAGQITLHTQRGGINRVDMNFAELFFHTMVDPNIALILLNIGLLAIAVELYNPGATIPAVVGGICLVLAFVALGQLPVNWGGVILIILAVAFFILDIKVTGFVLTVGGIAMFILGALLLFVPFTPPSPDVVTNVSVSPWVVFGMAGMMALFFVFVLGAAVRGHRAPVLMGAHTLVGAEGIATTALAPEGTVQLKSELWTATSQNDRIEKGQKVQVVSVDGLRLKVVKK